MRTVRCLRTGFRHKQTTVMFDKHGSNTNTPLFDLTKTWYQLKIDVNASYALNSIQFEYHPRHKQLDRLPMYQVELENKCRLDIRTGRNLRRFLASSLADQNVNVQSDRNFVMALIDADHYHLSTGSHPGSIICFTSKDRHRRYYGLYLWNNFYMTKPYNDSGIYIGDFSSRSPTYITGEAATLTFLEPEFGINFYRNRNLVEERQLRILA